MAFSVVGGFMKIGRGIGKMVKGIANGEGEEVLKGAVKIVHGTGRVIGGLIAGETYVGGESTDESDEEY